MNHKKIGKRFAFSALLAVIAFVVLAQTAHAQHTYTSCYPSCNLYQSGYTCPASCPNESVVGACQVYSTTKAGIAINVPGVECYPFNITAACSPIPSQIAQSISTYEPWYCSINKQIYSEWAPYIPIALLAVLLSFIIAALIIMIGIAGHSERIKNFGVGEAYEAVASALIVGLFIYICAVIFGVTPGLFVGAINPYATAFNLIGNTINNAEGVVTALANVYMHDAEYTSFQIGISFSSTKISIIQNVLLGTYYNYLIIYFMDPALNLAGLLSDGIIALYAQYFILVFFSVASIPVFLIPGVIFRAFLPTRAFGGILISIAIGFYLVAPTLFALAYYFTAPNLIQNLAASEAQINRFGGSASVQNSLSPTSPLVLQVSSTLSAMSSFWLLILFYPIFITSVTYAFITQLANFIGGASRLGGRMRGFI
ncbi:MAG: hypothetical protein ACP5TL_00665 [Candidatus Micrarchaeia archaeon]